MKFSELAGTPLQQILEAFNESFSDYVVPFQLTASSLDLKIRHEGIDLSRSYGAFDGSRLCALMLQAVGSPFGQPEVFNGGTGVLPAYRGRGLAYRLYEHSIRMLADVPLHRLEVIKENAPAVRLYQSLGFKSLRQMCAWKGQVQAEPSGFSIKPLQPGAGLMRPGWKLSRPTWQNSLEAVMRTAESHITLGAWREGQLLGWGVVYPQTGLLRLLAVAPGARRQGVGRSLLAALGAHCPEQSIRINYVDEQDAESIGFLEALGFNRFLDSLEMLLDSRAPRIQTEP